MTLQEKTCILFSNLAFATPLKQFEVLKLYSDCEELWSDFPSKREKVRALIGDKQYERLAYAIANNIVDNFIDAYVTNGVEPITYFSKDYPDRLRQLPDPPLTLSAIGNTALLNKDSIAIVGTRKISAYGRRVTENFTAELCRALVIVSGLAYGVDACAHTKTLELGEETIAVLGSGVRNIYPKANESLSKRIVESNGLLLSEFNTFDDPINYHFPMRNRIVSGLSKGVLVTEASLKSGVFSTVDYALEQGKDVFVVPGEIYNYNSMGCNDLIKNMQGAITISPSDVLSALGYGKESLI
ncbi:MAG: DNA-processing protein DprA, partial [Clostridia bacterium]